MKNRYIILLIFLFTHTNVQANELWESIKNGTSDVLEKSTKVIQKTENKVKTNLTADDDRIVREENSFSVNFNYSPINVPFPMAWGVNGYYIASGNWMIGVDYLNSGKAIKFFSFEIGEVKEKSYTIQAKRFFGNNFNVKFGLGKRSTEVNFAKNLLDLATKSYSETAAKFESNFLRLGIGNQWQFKKKYTLAIDWISVDIPFSGNIVTSASRYAKSDSDKKDIQNSENILKYYPGGGAIKFDIGIIF